MADPRITASTLAPPPSLKRTAAPAPLTSAPSAVAGDNGGVSEVARVLAGLRGKSGLERVTPAQWQAVFASLDQATEAQVQAISRSLLKQGLLLKVQKDAGLISMFGEQGAITWNTGALRVTIGGSSTIFQGTTKVGTVLGMPDGTLIVTKNGKTQVWDSDSGLGTIDGKPIPARWTPPVKGEAPRVPWATPPTDHYVDPSTDQAEGPDYWKMCDDAVIKAGGKVIEPMALTTEDARRYNCHSFTLSGGHGDLTDPYDKVYQPRWLNFPTYELQTGAYTQLKPEQRVHVGDVVLYQQDGVIVHSGVVKAVDADGNPARVESKWGTRGLYEHGPLDVPARYGAIAGYYRPEAK